MTRGLLLVSLLWALPVFPAARMISYGYKNCVACHETTLGKGILTHYGNSVDSAQSLSRDDYRPSSSAFALLLRGPNQSINQDLRLKLAAEDGPEDVDKQKGALYHRGIFRLNKTFQINSQVSVSQVKTITPQEETVTDPVTVVERLLLESRWKIGSTVYELSFGRDALPSGISLGNETSYLKSLNNMGTGIYPLQLRLSSYNDKYLYSAYAYSPSSESDPYNKERGAGGLAEFYPSALNAAIGITGQRAVNVGNEAGREAFGAYLRLGVTKYLGLMHETVRTQFQGEARSVRRRLSHYTEVHAHLREWLVAQYAWESYDQDRSSDNHVERSKAGLSARLSRNSTVSIDQWQQAGRKTFVLGIAAKT